MTIELELQIATNIKTLPHPSQFKEWVSATFWQRLDTAELTIRLVDSEESANLNQEYRHKSGPTNVLSFPYEPMPGIVSKFIGDIVICAPVVESESLKKDKPLLAYWAHMVIHGTLHLLGYDHETAEDSTEMEAIETEIMLRLGFPPPYGDHIVS